MFQKIDETEENALEFNDCPQSETTYSLTTEALSQRLYKGTVRSQVKVLECLVRGSQEYSKAYADSIEKILQGDKNSARIVVAMMCYRVAQNYDSISQQRTGETFFYSAIEEVAEKVYSSIQERVQETVNLGEDNG